MPRYAYKALLYCLLLGSLPAPAQVAEKLNMLPGEYRDDTWASDSEREAEQSLRQSISRIESTQGAYAPGLSEQMLSLGLALQKQQRHVEAVDVFKRGVHLARINSGLYCPEQIPLLQGEVRSHIALGHYAEADELQSYLYRVQLRAMDSGEERADALVQQANWQFNAHRLGLGWQGPGRLSNMWELYSQAFQDILTADGEDSPKLLTPLWGMLRTQYLVSEYRETAVQPANGVYSSALSQDLNRFYTDRSENYDRGKSIVATIYQVQSSNHGEHSSQALAALVQLGDWALWNDREEESLEIYRLVLAELAREDAAKLDEVAYFDQPVALPDIDGLRRLPHSVSTDKGNILVEFNVDSRGRVRDLERVDDNGEMDSVATRLLRDLRATRFRPRFEADEPVQTDNVVRAYDVKQ